MRVVIPGGSGFLGTAITAALLEDGHSVALLTRDASRVREQVDRRVELVEWDTRSPGPWEETIDGAGGVINLTGEPVAARRWTREQKALLRASRIDSAKALTRAIEKAAVRPVVLLTASGVGYYGPRRDEELPEDAPPGRDFMAILCCDREAAASAAEPLGTRVVQMRIGVVLSQDSPLIQRMLRPFKLFAGGPLGSGRQWWSWIHRDDVVGLVRFALENEAVRGPLNVTAPEPVKMVEFARTLGRVLGRPSWLPVPAPALRLLLGEMAEMALSGQRVVPREALRLGYEFRYPRLEAALRAILSG